MLKIKIKRVPSGVCSQRCAEATQACPGVPPASGPGEAPSDEILSSCGGGTSLWEPKHHGLKSAFCSHSSWPRAFAEVEFLLLKGQEEGGVVLFPATSPVAIAAVQNHTKMSPAAAAQETQALKWAQFWPFPWVTSIMFIPVHRLSSLIPKPTCPRLLTAVQAAPCVSASALLSTASAWFPGRHRTNRGAGCPWPWAAPSHGLPLALGLRAEVARPTADASCTLVWCGWFAL